MSVTIETQLEREASFKILAAEKKRKLNLESAGSDREGGKKIVNSEDVIVQIAGALQDMIDRVESGKAGAGRPALAVRYILQLEPVAVALLTARVCIDAAAGRHTLVRAAMRLAGLIQDHYTFDQMEQDAPGLVHYVQEKQRKRPAGKFKATIMRHAAAHVNVQPISFGEGEKVKLGTKLIEVMQDATGLLKTANIRTNAKRVHKQLLFTDKAAKFMEDWDKWSELAACDHRPMLVPPQPWVSPIRGGYLSDSQRLDLVRSTADTTRDDLFSAEMQEVYDAVNTIQETPWRINKALFDTLKEVRESGGRLGGLPQADDLPVPERPADIPVDRRIADMDEAEHRRFKTWKMDAAQVHDDNHAAQSKRKALVMQMASAEELAQWDRFWFPHNLDFRGRLYPIPPVLNPQSDDSGRALLEFADGKPLGKSGAYWLCVHIANLFGEDKISFDDRVNWVNDNSAALFDSAMQPLDGQRFWETADKPWCALAACFEYAGWFITGDEYVSHLPIAMDGSCSGLQHFSAMMKDEVGGEAVNLTNTDVPNDIYTMVLDVVMGKLTKLREPLAQSWLPKLSRKIVKRPCMTFAYSVTSRGITDQIKDELRKSHGEQALPGYENAEAAKYLAPYVEDAIRDVVVKGAIAMDWLKAATKVLTQHKIPLMWVTPVGLPVIQSRRKYTSKLHKMWYGGQRIRLALVTATKVLDTAKQLTSVAPNLVHSMDAAHLMLVTNRMVSEGVTTNFSMIHDSFGVHACDIDELNYVIRDEFVKMYTDNQLERFRNFVICRLPLAERDDVPLVPEQGALNLEEVRDADFFFA
jgi:DNA-directed RNA polymerase